MTLVHLVTKVPVKCRVNIPAKYPDLHFSLKPSPRVVVGLPAAGTDEPDEEDDGGWNGSRAKCETHGWKIIILS